jgi:hypothetical protein
VYAGAHWRIYRVESPTPLLSGPGRLTRLGHDSFALSAAAAGRFVVRVRFSRYLTFTRGRGCVGAAPGGWTSLNVTERGPVVIAARFSWSRAFSSAPC